MELHADCWDAGIACCLLAFFSVTELSVSVDLTVFTLVLFWLLVYWSTYSYVCLCHLQSKGDSSRWSLEGAQQKALCSAPCVKTSVCVSFLQLLFSYMVFSLTAYTGYMLMRAFIFHACLCTFQSVLISCRQIYCCTNYIFIKVFMLQVNSPLCAS